MHSSEIGGVDIQVDHAEHDGEDDQQKDARHVHWRVTPVGNVQTLLHLEVASQTRRVLVGQYDRLAAIAGSGGGVNVSLRLLRHFRFLPQLRIVELLSRLLTACTLEKK